MGRDTLKYTHATQGTKNKSINGWTIKALLFLDKGKKSRVRGQRTEQIVFLGS